MLATMLPHGLASLQVYGQDPEGDPNKLLSHFWNLGMLLVSYGSVPSLI